MKSHGWRPTSSPSEQVRVADLAAEYVDCVKLHTPDNSEALPEFEYTSYTSGEREVGVLPAKFTAPSFVAAIENGQSFGRHCCAIGPDGKAVRETGFNLDGEVLSERLPVSRYRPKYWRKR
ncbi:MAG: hypothetical protein ACR2NU_12895 [Aeoliella sp.]